MEACIVNSVSSLLKCFNFAKCLLFHLKKQDFDHHICCNFCLQKCVLFTGCRRKKVLVWNLSSTNTCDCSGPIWILLDRFMPFCLFVWSIFVIWICEHKISERYFFLGYPVYSYSGWGSCPSSVFCLGVFAQASREQESHMLRILAREYFGSATDQTCQPFQS